jgi:hypothetical protein
MIDLSQHYEQVRKSLHAAGHATDHLEKLASLLLRLDRQHLDVSFAEFHNYAGRLPYMSDSDFGALVLEREADLNATGQLKGRLYREAIWRARWCAQAATAGGEGLARVEDVDRLMSKSKEAEPDHWSQQPPRDAVRP